MVEQSSLYIGLFVLVAIVFIVYLFMPNNCNEGATKVGENATFPKPADTATETVAAVGTGSVLTASPVVTGSLATAFQTSPMLATDIPISTTSVPQFATTANSSPTTSTAPTTTPATPTPTAAVPEAPAGTLAPVTPVTTSSPAVWIK